MNLGNWVIVVVIQFFAVKGTADAFYARDQVCFWVNLFSLCVWSMVLGSAVIDAVNASIRRRRKLT